MLKKAGPPAVKAAVEAVDGGRTARLRGRKRLCPNRPPCLQQSLRRRPQRPATTKHRTTSIATADRGMSSGRAKDSAPTMHRARIRRAVTSADHATTAATMTAMTARRWLASAITYRSSCAGQ